jgi:peptide/nickel transport system ATP-binding protein
MTAPVLALTHVSKMFGDAKHGIRALDDVSFDLHPGRALALVGGSGSGKTTCARILTGLETPTEGSVQFNGHDTRTLTGAVDKRRFARAVQMVFQDPYAALNPVHSIHHHLVRPLKLHGGLVPGQSAEAAVAGLLAEVGLDPARIQHRYPHELSGGQRQRVNIARALAAKPDVILADEPTSMLDVSLRVGVLTVLKRLKTERGLALLYITHDLATAEYVADEIAVMHQGRVVEHGPVRQVITQPVHAYTRQLLAAAPNADRVRGRARNHDPAAAAKLEA